MFRRRCISIVLVAAGLCLLPALAQANAHLLPIRIGMPHKTLGLDYFF